MGQGPIKLLLFSTLYPHEGEPSLGIFVHRRLKYLLQQGNIDCRVIAPVPWFPLKNPVFGSYGRAARASKRTVYDGLDVQHPRYLVIPKVGMRITPWTLAGAGLRAMKRLAAEGWVPDVIDAHYLYPDGVAAQRIAASIGKPFVMTARGSDVTQIPDYPFARTRILKAITACERVHTVAEALRRDLIGLGAEGSKIVTLRNGVDLTVFHPSRRQAGLDRLARFGVRPELGPIILSAGWLIPRKRVHLTIEALSQIGAAQLVVAGDGEEREALTVLAQDLGVLDRVHFVGLVDPDDMPDLMAASDIMVLASSREGWANVLLEAMASATPVVATDVGGARECVQQPGGVVVDAATPDAIAGAVRTILQERETFSPEQARAYAEGFSWDATSVAQADLFQALAKKIK